MDEVSRRAINTWNESLLHEELKDIYCGETGRKEVLVQGSICDVVLQDNTIVEIQTANLGQLKGKLEKLLSAYKVILVYPVAVTTRIETWTPDRTLKSSRKSPKKGTVFQVFRELTGIHGLIGHPHLTLSVVLIDILDIRIADGTGSWRRKGVRREDRKLLNIHETLTYATQKDFLSTIPASVPPVFTVRDLQAGGAGIHAGRMAWVLRKIGMIELVGKKGNAFLYRQIGN
jgi:hypothetical protein